MKVKISLLFFFVSLSLFANTQKEFIRIHKEGWNKSVGMVGRSSILSTVLPNTALSAGRGYKKRGFQSLVVKNSAGFKWQVRYRMHKKKKPLVIYLAGLASGSDMVAALNVFSKSAKKQGFHTAIFESTTSPEWMMRNRYFLFSGLESGWELRLAIKEFLQREDIRKRYSSVHLVGLSLGGHDALYVASFDQKSDDPFLTGGVINFSSPVDRLLAFHQMRIQEGVAGRIAKSMFSRVFSGLKEIHPKLAHYDYSDFEDIESTKTLIGKMFFPFARKYFQHFEVDSRLGFSLEEFSMGRYFEGFQGPHLVSRLKHPILYIHAENDPLVDYKEVQKALSDASNDHVGLVVTKYGGHVGFTMSYGKKWVKRVIRDYLNFWSPI